MKFWTLALPLVAVEAGIGERCPPSPTAAQPTAGTVHTTSSPGASLAQETETVTDISLTDHNEGGRAPERPSPQLTIDLSDAEAIARTAHDVAVALAEGRLSGRAGQALMTAIRLAIEARKPAPPPPPPPRTKGPLIRLELPS